MPAELVIDVSDALPFDERTAIAASVHLPAGGEPPRAAMICWPGGSYSRAYWDMRIAGHPGYSFAEHMTRQGFAVVAADHLGVGASTKPADGDQVGFATMSAAAAAFAEQVRARMNIPLIGIGHSLGACLTVVAQARHRAYDAVALLGFTHGEKEIPVTGAGTAREAAIAQARAFFGDTWDDVYALAAREPNHGWLYRPGVPAAVIAADDAEAVRWPRQSYVEALLAGHSAPFAAEVDCDVFLGFGDHDVAAVPHDDVAYYTGSRDVTLYVLRDAAHCHNFATTRTLLWDRIGGWARERAPLPT